MPKGKLAPDKWGCVKKKYIWPVLPGRNILKCVAGKKKLFENVKVRENDGPLVLTNGWKEQLAYTFCEHMLPIADRLHKYRSEPGLSYTTRELKGSVVFNFLKEGQQEINKELT